MSSWLERTFAQAVAETRHELLGGWFGRNFEPYPQAQPEPAERQPGERDIHGNEVDLDR